jgi:delta24-sterol reductase
MSTRIFEYVMTEYRSLIVVVFALPLSLLWDTFLYTRQKLVAWLMTAASSHADRVRKVEAQVKGRPTGMRMCTGRPGWQSMSLSYRNCAPPPARLAVRVWCLSRCMMCTCGRGCACACVISLVEDTLSACVCLPTPPPPLPPPPPTDKKDSYAVDSLCEMIDIVSIDLESETPTITVEPLVTTGQVTHALSQHGYTLPVVPEMDDLTMGGLVNGTGIESSSHRHGLFHEQCVEFELILADGRVVRANAENEHAELFHAIPWSYGTLGFLLSVKIRVIPSKPYVRLTYTPHHTQASGVGHFAKASEAGESAPIFVEALAFSDTEYIVMEGEFADKPAADGVVNHLGSWYKPWFFKHCESKLRGGRGEKNTEQTVEYIPLRDYYHRHTKSMFWEMELMLPVGNHPLARYLLGWMLPPKVSFLKLTQTEMTRKLTEETHVAQDFMLPMSELGSFMDCCHTVFDRIYPVWLCPHSHSSMPGTIMVDPPKPDKKTGVQMYVDVGVYGLPMCVKERRPQDFNHKAAMGVATSKLVEMKGVQMLYADIFLTRDEFERMYPHDAYRKIREKYGAIGVFPEVFNKINNVG